MNLGNLKKYGGRVILILTALGAAMDVFATDKKEKDYEALKKRVEKLESQK